jgi:hypothetical protein
MIDESPLLAADRADSSRTDMCRTARHRTGLLRVWHMPGALLVAVVPPIGAIGWASLLTAELMFPGVGWVGLVLLILSVVTIGARSWIMILALGGVAVAANFEFEKPRLSSWVGVHTDFGVIRLLEEFSAADLVQKTALATPMCSTILISSSKDLREWR